MSQLISFVFNCFGDIISWSFSTYIVPGVSIGAFFVVGDVFIILIVAIFRKAL